MFDRNGYVMRTAYPQGYAGTTVGFFTTLGLFASAVWKKSRLYSLYEAGRDGFFSAFIVFGWLVWNLVNLIGFGSLYTFNEDPTKWTKIPIRFISKALPAFWISVGMLGLAVIATFPAIIFLQALAGGTIVVMALIFSFLMPIVVSDKFYRPRQRARFMRHLKDYAPPLARHLRSPWLRKQKAKIKARLQVTVRD